MKLKQIILVVALSAGTALGSMWIYSKYFSKQSLFAQSPNGKYPANYAGYFDGTKFNSPDPFDFTKAANTAVPAVVHIKTKTPAKKISNDLPRNRGSIDDWFNQWFNFGPNIIPEQRASGSGVIISADGYIVTNNHVIADGEDGKGVADEITVTLHNKKMYKARVIGRDPSSDIAVLKIDATGLPFLLYGNSDNLQLGQWVLAIGYPLSLETTVTAGIVSAKGRSININSRQSDAPIESFIQTDAAVNPGNSGGALVNTDGQLIGINSAILAPNGTYAGYSFAIPVNIVKKVVNDLIEYGNVKRGYLGVSYIPSDDDNEQSVKKAGLKDGQGVYVSAVPSDGGAAQAGIKKGDVITKVNNVSVASGLEMSAQIVSLRPGDKVKITYVRDGKEYNTNVSLKDSPGKLELVAVNSNLSDILGGELENLSKTKADSYDISGGVVVKKIISGGALSKTRMQEGFIITSVNDRDINSIDDLKNALSGISGTVRLEGIYPGYDGTYTYPLNLGDQ
ncbi:MAG: trypsin-like peptidase domain-containing protein [Bacteroidetes bacterium]|nr:trypsin-like peptidase domain-containing protein [Bacteroidota bacterium]MBS1930425.1 trypsin-like peptidase domain-containing protein [Bacteroidota bacterium]